MQLYYHLLNRVNQGTLVTSGNSGAFSIVRTPSCGDCLDTAGKLFTWVMSTGSKGLHASNPVPAQVSAPFLECLIQEVWRGPPCPHKLCVFYTFPDATASAGLGSTLGEPLGKAVMSRCFLLTCQAVHSSSGWGTPDPAAGVWSFWLISDFRRESQGRGRVMLRFRNRASEFSKVESIGNS